MQSRSDVKPIIPNKSLTAGEGEVGKRKPTPICFFHPEAYNHSWESELFLVPRMFLSKSAIEMADQHLSIKLPTQKRNWISDESIQMKKLARIKEQIFAPNAVKGEEPQKKTATIAGQKRPADNASSARTTSFPMPEPGTPDSFDRTTLLLNLEQMIYERIPVPAELVASEAKRCSTSAAVAAAKNSLSADFVATKPSYRPVSEMSPMYAIDCEMVVTKAGSELARVTMVDECNFVCFDRLVKPENPVEDYVTRFSGITRDMLAPVVTTVADVQRELTELLPSDAILVGHSIGNDLHSMKVFHPYLIDTSVIYNLKGARNSKARLRFLAEHFLGRLIQSGKSGHSSAEDAIATMDLVRLKLSQEISFGDVTTSWRFPENYYRLNLSRVDTKSLPKLSTPRDAKAPPTPSDFSLPSNLRPNLVHSGFRSHVGKLIADYGTHGPPIHFMHRLVNDAALSHAQFPIFPPSVEVEEKEEEKIVEETAESMSNGNDEPSRAGTDEKVHNNSSPLTRPFTKWLTELSSSKTLTVAKASCSVEWDEEKCNRKVLKLIKKLHTGLPDNSLFLLVCTGDGPTAFAPSLEPLKQKNKKAASVRMESDTSLEELKLLSNAKRYAYISLIHREAGEMT